MGSEPMIQPVRVTQEELDEQRAKGWTDFHPEDFCHRCGNRNISWFINPGVWNEVMRPEGPDASWFWQEIICPICFVELAEAVDGSWELIPSYGTKWFEKEG